MKYNLLSSVGILLALSIVQSCPRAIGETQPHERLPAPLLPASSQATGDASATPPLRQKSNSSQGDNSPNGVSSAPGADAMMTPDLLLVSPSKGGQAPKPLQDFVGTSLKMSIEHSDIVLDGLHGLMITVINDTSRPLVIDGDNAKIMVSSKTYSSASVSVVQKSVRPNHNAAIKISWGLIEIAAAGLTVGAIPTVQDVITIKKPIRKRYGADERRRLVEASRFGKRILWPHQKTQGIVYFQTADAFNNAKMQMPVHTLFDKPDNALLTSY